MAGVHVHCGAEHHVGSDNWKSCRKQISKQGYKLYGTCAGETLTQEGNKGTTGGTWVLVRKDMVGTHGCLLYRDLQTQHHRAWSAAKVRMQGFDLIIVSIYLETDLGPTQYNWEQLTDLGIWLSGI